MAGNVVGSASVVIEADLADFGREARTKLDGALRPLAGTVDRGLERAGEGAAAAGQKVGKRAGGSINDGLRSTAGETARAGSRSGERAGQGFASGLRGRVNSGLSGLREKLSGQMGDLAKVAAGAFAVDKVSEFFGSAIDEATESQKVNAQTATVLRATGQAAGLSAGQVGDLATEISNYAGIDDEAIQAGENLLLNFKNLHDQAGAGNDVFSRATKIATDYSVATGTSLTGAMRTFGKALNDPVKGMGALSKAGVTLTDQQKAQVKAMVASGDTMGAQKLLLDQLEARYKGSAAAQATAGEKATVAWGNFKEQIGGILLPIIATVSNFLTTEVVPALSSMVTWLQNNGDTVKIVVAAIAPLLVAWGAYNAYLKGSEMWTKAVGAAQRITAGITALFTGATEAQTVAAEAQTAAAEAGTVAQEELNVAMEANPIGLIIAAIAALAAGFYLAWQHSATFRRIVTTALDAVKDAALFLWHHVIAPFFRVWQTEFAAARDIALFLWHHVMEPVGHGIATAFGWISNGAHDAWTVISRVYGWIRSGIHGVSDVVHTVTRAVSGAFRKIGDGLQWAWNHTLGPVFTLIQDAIGWVRDALSWLDGGTRTGMQNLGQIPTDYSGLGGLPSSGQLGALTPPPAGHHAKGGLLGSVDVVGEQGRELLLNGRMVVSNPRTSGGNFDEFANAIVDKLDKRGVRPTIGTVELHYPKPDTIDRGLAAAMRSATTVLGR